MSRSLSTKELHGMAFANQLQKVIKNLFYFKLTIHGIFLTFQQLPVTGIPRVIFIKFFGPIFEPDKTIPPLIWALFLRIHKEAKYLN